MKRLSNYEVSDVGYNQIIANQNQNKVDLIEVIVGSRKKLYTTKVHGEKKLICTNKVDDSGALIGNLKQSSFITFLAEFKRVLNKQILDKPDLLDLKIDFKGLSRNKNIKYFDNLNIGDYFYCIDFNSAYWQMANKIGYITPELYKNYIRLNDYKHAKRLCFSFLARSVKARYSSAGISISCDTRVYKRIYDNVRNLLYMYLMNCVKLSNNEYIEYNIDSITIMADKVNAIKDYLKQNDLIFKITECRKVSETEYLSDYNLIKFKINK